MPAAFFSIHDPGRAASPSAWRSFHSSAAALLLPPSPRLGRLASDAVAERHPRWHPVGIARARQQQHQQDQQEEKEEREEKKEEDDGATTS